VPAGVRGAQVAGRPRPSVLLVEQANLVAKRSQNLASGVRGPVVNNDDLKIPTFLRQHRFQGPLQKRGAIVGRHNDGKKAHWPGPLYLGFCSFARPILIMRKSCAGTRTRKVLPSASNARGVLFKAVLYSPDF